MRASSQRRMPDIAGAVITAPGTSSSRARNPGNELTARLGCSERTMNSDVGRKQLMFMNQLAEWYAHVDSLIVIRF